MMSLDWRCYGWQKAGNQDTYVLKKAESENIDNKVLAFKTVTETSKSVYLTLITTNGLVDNEYARKFQNVLFLDSLFTC